MKRNPIILECVQNGVFIDLNNLEPDMIRFDDIATGLARQFRFNGLMPLAMWQHYSVAEHSVHVMRAIPYIANTNYIRNKLFTSMEIKHMQMLALIHDASEAYLSDMTSPTKKELPDYKMLENRVQNFMYEMFCFDAHKDAYYMAILKEADYQVLLWEMKSCGKQAIDEPSVLHSMWGDLAFDKTMAESKQLFTDAFNQLTMEIS